MSKRPQHIPLYEVMRGSYEQAGQPASGPPVNPSTPTTPRQPPPATSALAPDAATGQVSDGLQSQDVPATSLGQWVSRAGHPVVLRLPKGLVWLMCIAAMGMFVLAYWIGAQRGIAAGRQQVISQLKARQANRKQVRDNALHLPGAGFRAGRSYWVLVELPMIAQTQKQTYQEAKRLMAFLKDHGVDARANPVHNTLLRITELHGFDEGQMAHSTNVDYRARLAQLGRQWKHVSKGSSDFSMMWPMKYTGE